jgi:hypothetical protein
MDLSITDKYKYLCVFFDEHLTFEYCASILGNSAGRALGGVIAKFKQFKNVGYKTYTKMYEAAVVPVSDYASGVWGYKDYISHNNVHNRALRYFLGVHRFAPNAAIQGDMGWRPPKYRRILNILLLWNRLVDMNANNVAKLMFDYDYHVCNNNWCSDVKHLSQLLNNSRTFDEREQFNVDTVVKNINEIIQTEWYNDLSNKPKLRTYRKYKQTVGVEPYILQFMSRKSRSLLSQFRCGILPLRIETGRFQNIELENRLCKYCECNVIEDEKHFLCECTLYNSERMNLYREARCVIQDFDDMSADDKFCAIVNSCQKSLSKYIYDAWNVRQQMCYM